MTTARREEIIEAAVEVFAERGYRGASFDAVAERAGLTRQGVLHYFPSKKKLLMAVLRFREELSRDYLAADHAEEDFPTQLAEAMAFDHKNPALAQVHSVLMAEGSVVGDPAREDIQAYCLELREHTVERLTERYGERLPSGLTPQAAATAVLMMIDGMQQQWLLYQDQTDYPGMMRDVLAVLLGTAAETSAPTSMTTMSG